jgi:hypothetical protein
MDAIELNLEEFLNLSPVDKQNEQHSEQSAKYIEQYAQHHFVQNVEQKNENHFEKNVEQNDEHRFVQNDKYIIQPHAEHNEQNNEHIAQPHIDIYARQSIILNNQNDVSENRRVIFTRTSKSNKHTILFILLIWNIITVAIYLEVINTNAIMSNFFTLDLFVSYCYLLKKFSTNKIITKLVNAYIVLDIIPGLVVIYISLVEWNNSYIGFLIVILFKILVELLMLFY